jgi:hypothetical protein
VLFVASCSSGKKASIAATATTTAAAPRILSACKVVDAADASQVFGQTAKLTTVNRPNGAVSVCAWGADSQKDPNDPRDIARKLEIDAYQGSQYYAEHSFAKPTRLPGIGDHAFVVVAPNILQGQVEKNGSVISLTYSLTAPFIRPSPTLSSHVNAFTGLMRAAAARM